MEYFSPETIFFQKKITKTTLLPIATMFVFCFVFFGKDTVKINLKFEKNGHNIWRADRATFQVLKVV